MKARQHAWVLILLLLFVSSCGGRGGDDKPSVKILSPSDQHTIVLGQTLNIESRAKDDNGITRIELRINGVQVDLYEVPKGEKSFRLEQVWLPPTVGTFSASVIAYDTKEHESAPATITFTVQAASTPTQTPLPTDTTAPTSTPGQTSPEPQGCTYDAAFVTDVTIPDNTRLDPETEFVKTWRLRNSGSCAWGADILFVFVKGEQMGGPASVPVPPTAVGATVDISVPLRAPQKPGTYRGTWRLRRPNGEEFGVRPYVQIVVPSPATPTPSVTPTTTPLPKADLDITVVSGDMQLTVGETLALLVTVRNHGPGATHQPAVVRAVLRAGLEVESSVPTLSIGGQEVASIKHTFDEPADLEVSITVDPDNAIAEEDEENNTERVTVIVNPSIYATRTITATVGLGFDLDDAASDPPQLDIEWQVTEGTVYLVSLNGAGTALLSGEPESVSYALAAGLNWQTGPLALVDLAEGSLFGFRTSAGRVGYARVEAVLDAARTSARLTYLVWDWP